jgi:periplasmic protein TonB
VFDPPPAPAETAAELPRQPPAPPPPKPRPPKAETPPPRAAERAVEQAAAATAPRPTAPVRAPAPAVAAAAPSWHGAVLAHLERHKRYPARARARRQEGTTLVRFTVDRDGEVLRVALAEPSGHAALDEEALALLPRAAPLPAPPAGAGAGPFELVVPVQFRLR